MRPFVILSLLLLLNGCALFRPSHYDTRDLQFRNDGYTFTGTLYTPKSAPPYPLAVIAHGAGDSKRSFSLYTHFGEELTRSGIAVFIFDKRGVGDSEGTFPEDALYLDSLGRDLSAAFRFASHLPVTSPARSGFIGISQAGWTIPLALQSIDTIGFIVNISGPSVPPYFSDAYMRGNELRKEGYGEEEIREIVDYNRAVSRYVGTFEDRQSVLDLKLKYKDRKWFTELKYNPNLSPEETLRQPQYDHYRRSSFDPEPFWNRPDVPVLCLFGDKDAHIPADTIARRFEWIFQTKQYADFTVRRFPDGGHILQRVDGPLEKMGHDPLSMLIKGFPRPTDEAMKVIVQWIRIRTDQ